MNDDTEQTDTGARGRPRADEEHDPSILPVLPVRDLVVFPHMVPPLIVVRDRSVRALNEAKSSGSDILLVTQRDAQIQDPGIDDLYATGTVCRILQMLELPDATMRVVVEGMQRGRMGRVLESEQMIRARVAEVQEVEERSAHVQAMMRNIVSQFDQAVNLSRSIPPEALVTAMNVEHPGKLADLVAAYLSLPVPVKQDLLETLVSTERLQKLTTLLSQELEILRLERKIQSRVRDEVQDSQKEYYLREQLRAIQDELGEREGTLQDADEYREKIAKCGMPAEASEKAMREVERLEKMPPVAPEGTVIRTYLDWLVTLPWRKRTRDKLDISEAEGILDEDHYGLKRAKERVVEFLAVRKLVRRVKGPILCFIGPPGVGKTSIGRSIARALGRKFVRISLGGVRDEAEIRGHRRTYIGSMPGRVMQTLRTVGSRNPVFMLDEIDKIGIDFRGDPAAALLEVLDPEQNHSFSDHYLEVPFDLSEVMFIATGNLLDPVPPALTDRMEVIRFPGYVEEEKMQIARHFLLSKQIKENGLSADNVHFTTGALKEICRYYTRESGVRNLERELASVCRKVAKRVAQGRKGKARITPSRIESFLGPRRFRYGAMREEDEVGVATGLTYTEMGGDVLDIEVSLVDGSGDLSLTGRLGDVMKESAQAALSYARARAKQFKLDPKLFEKTDINIHVPEGAVPKEGPSAGITIAVALISALCKRAVRKDIAMTGEITLRGKILPVGGVREKVLAAYRGHISTVVLPKDNEKDLKELDELPVNVRDKIQFKLVEGMDEVLDIVLVPDGRRRRRKKT